MSFYQLAVSSTCHFINWLFHQLVILSTGCFINMSFYQMFHQHVILSTGFFIHLSFSQLSVSLTCHFINWLFHQLVIWSKHVNWPFFSKRCFNNAGFHWLFVSQTCHFVNFLFHQLAILPKDHLQVCHYKMIELQIDKKRIDKRKVL
jgi:hypothetical protein